MYYRKSACFVAVLFLYLVSSLSASARFIPKVGVESPNRGACLTVNGRIAMHLLTSNPKGRVKALKNRLSALLQKGYGPESVSFKHSGRRGANVMIGKSVFLPVSAAEAKAHGTSRPGLAESWAHSLRTLLAIPPLSVYPMNQLIPFGETRIIRIESLQAKPVSAESDDPAVTSVYVQSKTAVRVKGLNVGKSGVIVKCGEFEKRVQVVVQRYATYPQSVALRVVVTGHHPPSWLISQAAREVVRKGIVLEPGADVTRIDVFSSNTEARPGQVTRVPVRVVAEGEGLIAAQVDTQVEVENRVLPEADTTEIMYSNHPEHVTKYQDLFTGWLTRRKGSIRLLYHHQNDMKKKIGFTVDIANLSSAPATLHMIQGISTPSEDPVMVGYTAGFRFLENYGNTNGRIINIPPATHRAVVTQPLPAGCTASGILEFRVLEGNPLLVRVVAEPEIDRSRDNPDNPDISIISADLSSIKPSLEVYANPSQHLEATYSAGKPWLFLRLGQKGLKHESEKMELFGNYGVIYDIKLTLKNSLEVPQNTEVAFEATAGPVRGVFYVDDKLTKIGVIDVPQEARICEVTIPAKGKRVVNLRTMPLAGSSYPATIIVRPSSSGGPG